MPCSLVSSGDGHAVIPLHGAQGKALQSIQTYQMEEALALDLQFQDGMALELVFRVGFKASGTLLEYVNGDARVLKRIKPKRCHR